jgi:protein-disulfide isomerase
LIRNQDHSEKGLLDSAGAVGMNIAKFTQCLKGNDATQRVLADMADGRRDAVDGTPTLFVGDAKLILPNDPKELQAVIDTHIQDVSKTDTSVHQASVANRTTGVSQ